jgi:hypothetical protein
MAMSEFLARPSIYRRIMGGRPRPSTRALRPRLRVRALILEVVKTNTLILRSTRIAALSRTR